MAKKGSAKRKREEEREVTEDLDLDVGDFYEDDYADEDVVHNKGKKNKKHDDDDAFAHVLPSDAHKLDGYDEGGYLEEEELALTTEKNARRKAAEADFDVAGITVSKVKPAAKKKKSDLNANPILEAVERDFASLSKSERISILKKESPEVLKMLEELKTYLAEVKKLAQPLHELLYETKLTSEADKNLVSFLETKVQLMLSYCMHVTFYLLLKAEGKKVAGHPVVNSLVEIRVYLEKMWPLEEKLQYSINRLISGNKTSAAPASELRPLSSDPTFSGASRGALSNETRERRRAIQQQKEAMELEREEQSAMVRVQSKKASALNKVSLDTNFSPLSYNEEADQYLTKITGQDSDEDEGLSLTEALRQRRAKMEQIQQSKKPKKAEVYIDDDEEDDTDDDDDEEFGEDEEGDFGEEDDDDGMDEEDLDALWEEEKRREEEEAQPTTREPFTVQEVDRRKATKKIESHRGLTKARPKDRKNPRVAQRRKYERGLQKHKAQSGKQHEPEPEGGFIGVRSLKTGVVKANRLQ